jgi:hypothetical protein
MRRNREKDAGVYETPFSEKKKYQILLAAVRAAAKTFENIFRKNIF